MNAPINTSVCNPHCGGVEIHSAVTKRMPVFCPASIADTTARDMARPPCKHSLLFSDEYSSSLFSISAFFTSRSSALRSAYLYKKDERSEHGILKNTFFYRISGFRRGVVEVFALRGCYPAWASSWLPMFRDILLVPCSRVK